MPTPRLFVVLVLAASVLLPASNASAQVLLNPVTLTFDNIIDPLQPYGISSQASRQIAAAHNLARQEVALAIAYLSYNRQKILAGNDTIYNKVFGGFYDRRNANFGNGYLVDSSNYLRVLHTFGSIRRLLDQPTSYTSGLNNNIGGIAQLDLLCPKFQNLDRGMRQWGMSNSESTKVFDAYFPPSYGGLNGSLPSIAYPTGLAPGGRGSGNLVHWDQDTGNATPANPNTKYLLGQYLTIQDVNNPKLQFQQAFTIVNNTLVFSPSPLYAFESDNKLASRSVANAFYYQKEDIFGNPLNINQMTVGNVFLMNTDANRQAFLNGTLQGWERKDVGNNVAGLNTLNPTQLQTLPWNSGNPNPGQRASDFGIPQLNQYQMIIAAFSEFTFNPNNLKTGGAFFGFDSLIAATQPGVTQLLAGALDASNYGLFAQALTDNGFNDPRNFPPIGKNGSFQPAIPGAVY